MKTAQTTYKSVAEMIRAFSTGSKSRHFRKMMMRKLRKRQGLARIGIRKW